MKSVLTDSSVALICFLLGFLVLLSPSTNGIRGPHHPPGTPQNHPHQHHEHHHHYVPQRHDSGHGHSQPLPKLTQDKQLLHDTEHLKEDMGDWLFTDGKELSPEEMEFHYFKMHDFDNNSKLDGLEILKAISHILPMSESEHEEPRATLNLDAQQVEQDHLEFLRKAGEASKQRDENFKYYIDLIDKVLEDDDVDKDGYLSYAEYAVGRRRDENQMRGSS